jgi:hypothetical protein
MTRGRKETMSAQHKKFIEKAREIAADEESSAADALLARLAKRPPEPKKATPKRERRSTR